MKSDQLIEHLFRQEYGKLVATLTRIFGTAHIQLAEDVVQETLISALSHWGSGEIPENPSGWLMQVAKRKALNELKRNKMMREHHGVFSLGENSSSELDSIFLENEIEDSQLRMIFTCCHPSLKVDSQIALTLKTLCGFGVKEVARALLTSESIINKRLFRAKKSIRESDLPFVSPQGKELENRLETVSLTLYLLFNEGYNSASSETLIRKELCLEAIRLTQLLVHHFPEFKKLSALLALMCFHAARFDARLDDKGVIVLFENQNRKTWNQELIAFGMNYLQKSSGDSQLSAYHIEAGIAAEHCMAESFATTNWPSIYDSYQLLQKLKPNPIIALNLAIIESQISGFEKSLISLSELENSENLSDYYLLPATQGVFNMKVGNYKKAKFYLEKALKLKPSGAESEIVQRQILECESRLVE